MYLSFLLQNDLEKSSCKDLPDISVKGTNVKNKENKNSTLEETKLIGKTTR